LPAKVARPNFNTYLPFFSCKRDPIECCESDWTHMVKCRWAPTLIFPFTGVVVGIGLIILALIFKINAVNWEQEQMVYL
jgi:hypothetical protein